MKCSKCRTGRVSSRNSAYFGISKLIFYFPYCFHLPCAILFTVYFYVPCTVLFTVHFNTINICFPLFVIDCTQKQKLLIERFKFVFIKDLPSVSQSNEQAVTVKNKEHFTLSNITYIKFQNCCFGICYVTLSLTFFRSLLPLK